MIGYLSRRLLAAIPILVGVSIVVFVTLKLLTPGNPVDTLLGPTSTPADRTQLTKQLGLDNPVPVQFWDWFSRIVRGNFGTSIAQQLPARPIVLHAFAIDLFCRIRRPYCHHLRGGSRSVVGDSHGKSVRYPPRPDSVCSPSRFRSIPWLCCSSSCSASTSISSRPRGCTTLQAQEVREICFAIYCYPASARPSSRWGSLPECFGLPCWKSSGRTSSGHRARGLPMWRIYLHAFHNTLPSLLTVAGLQVGYLLGGVVFVETVFHGP